MKKTIFMLTLGALLTLNSCGEAEANFYTNDEIGWTMEIPEDWVVIDNETAQANSEQGLKIIEETTDAEVNYGGLKSLIGFKKDQFNIFQSTIEPFEPQYEGEWAVKNNEVKEVLYEAIINQGMKADLSDTTIVNIDGLDFETYAITVYGPDGAVIVNQLMISRLINGYDFSANLNYNNNEDRDELLSVFRNSKFKKNE